MLEQVASKWAPHGAPDDYEALRDRAAAHLMELGVSVTAFGHYGIVVASMDEALVWLADNIAAAWRTVQPVWGAAFGCHVASHTHDGTELELLQPVEQSFLRAAAETYGEGVQHLAFTVTSIADAVDTLRAAGAEMADDQIRNGVHGRIAFVRPAQLAPLCLELCEPYPDAAH